METPRTENRPWSFMIRIDVTPPVTFRGQKVVPTSRALAGMIGDRSGSTSPFLVDDTFWLRGRSQRHPRATPSPVVSRPDPLTRVGTAQRVGHWTMQACELIRVGRADGGCADSWLPHPPTVDIGWPAHCQRITGPTPVSSSSGRHDVISNPQQNGCPDWPEGGHRDPFGAPCT